MRLFAGLDLPAAVLENIGALIDHLRPAARLRWSPVTNLHVTTKFIGEWPEARLNEIQSALATVKGAPLDIEVKGIGWLPNPHSPRILYATVRAPQALPDLAANTECALEPLGIARETRDYKPHLTLARIGDDRSGLPELRRRIAGLESDDFGRFTAAQFHLYLSQPGSGGSVYSKLASFPLDHS